MLNIQSDTIEIVALRLKAGSTEELVSLVDRLGICYLFKKKDSFRLYDAITGEDSTTRRGKLLQWTEQAHLNRQIFLTVDEAGCLITLSKQKFSSLYAERSALKLSKDETNVLKSLAQAMSTPVLRKVSGLPAEQFDKALLGLRYKMRVALVEVKSESRTKHLNVYDRTESWLASR